MGNEWIGGAPDGARRRRITTDQGRVRTAIRFSVAARVTAKADQCAGVVDLHTDGAVNILVVVRIKEGTGIAGVAPRPGGVVPIPAN